MQFEWSLPTQIIFGMGRFKSTHKYIRGLGKRAFVVTSRSYANGGARSAVLDELLAQLTRLGVEHQVYSEIEPNPRTATIDRGAILLREFNPRFVIALGGGSVMDAGKCLSLLAVNPGGIYEYAHRGPGRPRTPFNHALPLICIPTIAATSSETDSYAVVTQWEEHRKVTVFGDALFPKLSIIDPELTFTVPERQTVDGAFDIITHVMESYLSSPVETPLQDRMSEAIVETVTTALPRVLENPHDESGRSQLSWCASLALCGVLSGRTGGWPIHAIEHGLSAYTDVAHGRGLALLLPRVMAFDAQAIGAKISAFNRTVFKLSASASEDPVESIRQGLVAYMRKVGAWTKLQDFTGQADLNTVIEQTMDHAFETGGIWKRGEEPYLENCKNLYREGLGSILKHCATDEF
ncbi:MAG: iron-containing alcohol dehydrogenase [Bdellovibrionota bacterium]